MTVAIPASGTRVVPALFSRITPKSTYLTSAATAPSTTYIDTLLAIDAAAGEVYNVDLKLYHRMSTTGDLSVRFTFPTPGVIHFGGYMPITTIAATVTSTASAEFRNRQDEDVSPSLGLAAGSMTDGNGVYSRIGLVWEATTAGTLKLQMATSSAAGTVSLLPGSSIMGWRIV